MLRSHILQIGLVIDKGAGFKIKGIADDLVLIGGDILLILDEIQSNTTMQL